MSKKEKLEKYVTFGNFRMPRETSYIQEDGTKWGHGVTPDADMMEKYRGTKKQEAQQYGEDTFNTKERSDAQYRSKYRSTTGASAGRTEWTFKQAYNAARKEGRKTFQMQKDGKWNTYETRRADETPEQFEQSFYQGTPEYEAGQEERSGRRRLGLTTDPYSNIDKKDKGGYINLIPRI